MVRGLRAISDFEFEFQMALTNKKLAPEIEFVCLMTSLEYAYLSSSILKEIALLGGDITGLAPAGYKRLCTPASPSSARKAPTACRFTRHAISLTRTQELARRRSRTCTP